MSLAQMLEGDFFTEFVKIGMILGRLLYVWPATRYGRLTMDAGDVIMTSRGRHDTDNVFTLKDGTSCYFRLCIWLDG